MSLPFPKTIINFKIISNFVNNILYYDSQSTAKERRQAKQHAGKTASRELDEEELDEDIALRAVLYGDDDEHDDDEDDEDDANPNVGYESQSEGTTGSEGEPSEVDWLDKQRRKTSRQKKLLEAKAAKPPLAPTSFNLRHKRPRKGESLNMRGEAQVAAKTMTLDIAVSQSERELRASKRSLKNVPQRIGTDTSRAEVRNENLRAVTQ
jgi:hypothetical protein